MKFVIFLLIALPAIQCEPEPVVAVTPQPVYGYNYGYGYGVPVASQPIYYGSPVQTRVVPPYAGTYAVHTSPAVSHTFSQTQTHPVAYVRPVSAYGVASSGQYYAPSTSNVEQTRLIVPQSSRVYQYQNGNQQYAYPQVRFQGGEGVNYGNGNGYENRQGYANQMPYTNNGEQVKTRRYQVHRPAIRKEFFDVEERVIVRPVGSALIELDPPFKKTPIKSDVTPNRSYGQNYYAPEFGRNNGQGQGFTPRNGQFNGNRQNQFSGANQQYRVNDCDLFVPNQTPIYEYGPPSTVYTPTPGQYHPTTFAPPTTTSGGYPTTTSGQYPNTRTTTSRQYPTTTSSSGGEYPTTTSGQYPTTNQYPTTTQYPTSSQYPTTNHYPTTTQYPTSSQYPTTTQYPTSSVYPTTTPYPSVTVPSRTYEPPYPDQTFSTNGQDEYPTTFTPGTFASERQPTTGSGTSEVFVSSTTPVTVTIVDKKGDGSKSGGGNRFNQTQFATQDIIYADNNRQQFGNENSPDQFRNELPPRGDIAQYQNERDEQFYHELPRSRYTNGPDRNPQAFNVYTKSRGEPTEAPAYYGEEAEVIEIQPKSRQNFTGNRNRTAGGNSQQQRLIQLYTGGEGGISEVGQTEGASGRYTAQNNYNSNNNNFNNRNGQYQDVGNVRARVVSVTPPPATAVPTETVNKRRIVVSKPVTTVQEVEETTGGPRTKGNYRANYQNGRDYNQNQNQNQYQGSDESENFGARGNYRANYQNERDFNQNQNQNQNFDDSENFQGNFENSQEFQSDGFNANYNADPNADFDNNQSFENDDNNSSENGFERNYDGGAQRANYENTNGGADKANYEEANAGGSKAQAQSQSQSTGFYISTTPSTASQRIIYVQPVSQDFAQQRAVSPKKQ